MTARGWSAGARPPGSRSAGPDRFAQAQRWWREQLERVHGVRRRGRRRQRSGRLCELRLRRRLDRAVGRGGAGGRARSPRRPGVAHHVRHPAAAVLARSRSPRRHLLRYAHGEASVTAYRAAVAEAVRRIAAGQRGQGGARPRPGRARRRADRRALRARRPRRPLSRLLDLRDRGPRRGDARAAAVVAGRPDHLAGPRRHDGARRRRGRRPAPERRAAALGQEPRGAPLCARLADPGAARRRRPR